MDVYQFSEYDEGEACEPWSLTSSRNTGVVAYCGITDSGSSTVMALSHEPKVVGTPALAQPNVSYR